MLRAVRHRWDQTRRLQMQVKPTVENNAGAHTVSTPVGAFAALLVEWKLAQRASDTESERATLKSA